MRRLVLKAGPLKGRPGLYLGTDRQARGHWRKDPVAASEAMLATARQRQGAERRSTAELRLERSGSVGPNKWQAIMVLPCGRALQAYGVEHERLAAQMGFQGSLRDAIRQGGVRAQYVEKWGPNPSTLGFEVGPGGLGLAIQLLDRFRADRYVVEESGGYRSFTDRGAVEAYLRGSA